jgi:hypothetical protein
MQDECYENTYSRTIYVIYYNVLAQLKHAYDNLLSILTIKMYRLSVKQIYILSASKEQRDKFCSQNLNIIEMDKA